NARSLGRLRWLVGVEPPHRESNKAATYQTGDQRGGNAPRPRPTIALQLLIVCLALQGVFQQLVGGNNLPKLQLGCRISGIDVGMIRLCRFAKGGSDCRLVGTRRYAQNIVKRVHGGPLVPVPYLKIRHRLLSLGCNLTSTLGQEADHDKADSKKI